MLPTLRPGRLVLVTTRGLPQEGDVVVVRHGGLEKIKRIERMHEGRLYLTGDNQAHSTDSRTFGWLDLSAVCGRVIWPRIARKKTETH